MINVYLGATRVGVQGPARPEQWVNGLSGEQVWAVLEEGLAAALEAAGPSRRWPARKPEVTVLLSGGWARPLLLAPVPGLKGWTEAMAVAQSLVAEQTGLQEPSVVWLDAWQPEQACIAVAASEAVLDRLHSLAAERAWRLRSVRPWWAQVLNVAFAGEHKPALLCVEEEAEALTLLAGAEGRWSTVKAVVPVPLQVAAVVQRAMLSGGAAAEQVLKVSLVGASALTEVNGEANGLENGERVVNGFASRWEWLA